MKRGTLFFLTTKGTKSTKKLPDQFHGDDAKKVS